MKVSWKTVLLWSIPLLLVGLLLWQGASNLMLNQSQPPLNTASTRMSYGRFLNYLDAGRISKVDIFDNGRTAIVDVSDPELINGRPCGYGWICRVQLQKSLVNCESSM